MQIKKSELEAVAVKKQQYPPEDLPEIAFAGRSNVGKSSLLNLLTGRKNLARVSSAPGKTRTINFYRINDEFRIVDLPGYGYASVSKSMSDSWGPMMDQYLKTRENLLCVVQLVDIRHEPSKLDRQMYEFLRSCGLSGIVAATKADKVGTNEVRKCLGTIKKTLELGDDDIIVPVSALKRTGTDKLLEVMNAILRTEDTY